MRKLSQHKISSITTLLAEGKTEAEVANLLGCHRTTVVRYRMKASNGVVTPVRGRPRKLTARDKRALARMIVRGESKTAVDATKIINSEREDKVSFATVRRALKEQGLKAVKKAKKPRLSSAHRKARLRWAREHENWTIEDWKRVIWSDETKINRINSDGIKYAWSKDSKSSPAVVAEETLKFGGGSIMIWGCMSWFGTGGLNQVVGRMNSDQLISILSTCLVPTVDEVASKLQLNARNDVIFQQDNDPKHTSAATKNWLATTGITTMNWPSQSPDLNPIEHLWCLVKRRLGQYQEPPNSMHELMERVDKVWQKVSQESCRTLIESMPSRVFAVKRVNGGHTKY